MRENSWKMTSCIKPVGKNNPKNKITQKSNSQLSDIFQIDKNQSKSELKNTDFTENRLQNKDGWVDQVQQIMDLTCRTEDEVIMAIHDCDEDLNLAVNTLLEGVSTEWEVKKKKARQSSSKSVSEQPQISEDKLRGSNDRSFSGRGRISHINRKWKRRENKENEKNTEERQESFLRSKKNQKRPGRGGRGGGCLGSRSNPNKDDTNPHSTSFNGPIETWTSRDETRSGESKKDCWNSGDANEDWDNEEYTGSLADTKVFTPSSNSCDDNTSSQKVKKKDLESVEPIKLSDLMSQNHQKQVKQRPRIPPPSRIPSSAVEMPGDSLNNSINYLDVQFGALEFGCESSLNDAAQQEKYIPSESFIDSSTLETSTKKVAASSLNTDMTENITGQKYKSLRNDDSTILNSDPNISNTASVDSQVGFTGGNIAQIPETQKSDLRSRTPYTCTSYDSALSFQTSKPTYTPSGTSYSSFTNNTQQPSTTFSCTTNGSNSDSFSTIVSMPQTGYKSSYSKSNMATFDPISTSTNTTGTYNQTSSSQGYSTTPGITTPVPQFSSASSTTNVSFSSTPYNSSDYPSSTTYNSSLPAYQSSNTTFSAISQGSHIYSNNSQSAYPNSFSNYGTKNQTISQSQKISSNKTMQFDNISSSVSLVTTTASALDLTSSSNTSQTKTTVSNGAQKNNLVVSSSSSNTATLSGSTGNIAPMLGHQYIMGQSVPYATFQQPHVYSYEDLQLMQQRISHMPSTGYYDATLGYQSAGPVTSLGSTRNDSLANAQNVQNVQPVQSQFNNLNDSRFTRADNTSPVSSTISQTSTQHTQPLINPIPPGYAYFYGGGIMPASGFQYGTPAMYPPIASANNTNSNNVSYTKPANYTSAYNSGANYDSLSNSGNTNDYKSTNSGYTNNQATKNTSSGGNSSAGNANDVNNVVYTKSHVTVSKINTYEKQNFHSGTTPPFGLTNSQNTNVISGYGAAHLFIPTVPHQLHQPLHQDSGNTNGQRTNSNSQNKSQIKSGYTGSYWTGSN